MLLANHAVPSRAADADDDAFASPDDEMAEENAKKRIAKVHIEHLVGLVKRLIADTWKERAFVCPKFGGASMPLGKRCAAEGFGTFWLVFGGCGSAVLAAAFPQVGIGLLGVSLAFGLTVLTMAYAIGHISGCHLNPAVTVGLVAGGRFKASEALPYIGSQVIGAIAAAGVLYVIASGKDGFSTAGGFASNGFGEHSPGGYSMVAALVAEIVLTAFFLLVIMGATDKRAPAGFAAIAIGLCLTLIHLIGIPVTNLSVNPARSTGPAIFVGGWAVQQLWLFWLAPLVGGALGGGLYRFLWEEAAVSAPRAQGTEAKIAAA